MSTEALTRTWRYLGGAFIFQFATSLAAGLLSRQVLTGSIAEVMAKISADPGQMRASLMLYLCTSVGIIVLTSLLYVTLLDQNRTIALVAHGLWMTEAVLLAVKTVGLYALVSLSVGADAGTPSAYDQALGAVSLGVSQHAGDVDMLFFCLGALLWYSLLVRSQRVPRLLSLWGLAASVLVLVSTVLLVWDRSQNPAIALYALYAPFELVLGVWLLLKGVRVRSPHIKAASGADVHEDVGEANQHHPIG